MTTKLNQISLETQAESKPQEADIKIGSQPLKADCLQQSSVTKPVCGEKKSTLGLRTLNTSHMTYDI